jgi:hypothetical protein
MERKKETVGSLVEKLVKFPFSTEVLNNCGSCHKGEVGGEVTISDQTNQTFGYIDLNFNQSWKQFNSPSDDAAQKEIDRLRMGIQAFVNKNFLGGAKADYEDYNTMVSCKDIWDLRELIK